MRLADLHQHLAALGALPVHRDRMLRAWLQGKPLDAGTRRQPAENVLPLSLRQGLPQLQEMLDGLARVSAEHPGADGSARLLVDLADGQMVESVLLPRDGVCVSSQVGCAVGCRFCMTGKSGLLRQVSSLEIIAQVVLARWRRPVKKVVFMGMGEPAHNLDNVLEAIDVLGTYGGIGHKNLVFSTVGDLRVFERLPQLRVKPALALSLHSTKAALREHLLPRAPRIDPGELVELGEIYARQVGYPIQYQWTLLKGINDGQDELDGILRLLKGKYAVLNLIPFNSLEGAAADGPGSDGAGAAGGTGVDVGAAAGTAGKGRGRDCGSGDQACATGTGGSGTGGDDYRRPDGARIVEMVHYLHSRGVLTKVRNSAGQDVAGGCGQLRARAVELVNTSRLRPSPR